MQAWGVINFQNNTTAMRDAATVFVAPVATTWNPANKSAGMNLTNGNLTATAGADANIFVRATNSHAAGKWYFEVTLAAVDSPGIHYMSVGIADSTSALTNILGFDTHSSGYADDSGGLAHLYANTFGTGPSATMFAVSQVISVAVDVPNHLIYWANNGTWQNSADPAAGTGGINYITTAPVFPAFVSNSGTANSVTLNVGGSAFSFSIPTGFLAWT